MIPCKPIGRRLTLSLLSFFIFSVINNVSAQDGKALFMAKCASCHKMGQDMTGPDLEGVEAKWGGDRVALRAWVHNWKELVAAGNENAVAAVGLKPSDMQVFGPSITDTEIDLILDYIRDWKPVVADTAEGGAADTKKSNQNAVIFGVISLILAIIALILMQVNSNLKKMSDDVEGIARPEPVPVYKNKVYIAIGAMIFFVIGGFYVTKGAIGLGRQKGYQPVQPIYYSHKVHAGINQISCLYCHGSAWDSKHATIPSVNICMNCHKSIKEYKGAPLHDESGKEINGTYEIQKLYKYAGFDPANPDAWDPTKAKPVEWIKIHNLPDHVYFNHSQHIRAGKVQCQSCHGEITAMDEVKQATELSMGWCVNCHRETKVDFNYSSGKGNQFYSIYEKFHNDIKKGKMDSVTVADIGGLECQKCHY